MFAKERFTKILSGYTEETIDYTYHKIIRKVLNQINGLLHFGGNELIVVHAQFIVKEKVSNIKVQAPKIKIIDCEYIKDISNRAMYDVEQKNYDSAITKSRTLLEETFCYVIKKKDERPSTSGKIGNLYNQVKGFYNKYARRCKYG